MILFARFKVPQCVDLLDVTQLPTTATGKVQKSRLAELVAQRPIQGGTS